MEAGLENVLLARERARHEALLAGDVPALSALLSDRLVFVHANGTVDGKDSLLSKMAGGSVKYAALSLEDVDVKMLGRTASLLTSRLTADLLVDGVPKRVCNLTLSAWTVEGGQWRLVAYQPTPLPC